MSKILLLGGTKEGREMADALAKDGIEAIYSYAGRTTAPMRQSLPIRVGGFGGVKGMCEEIIRSDIALILDATHPFAAKISANASKAALAQKIPYWRIDRPVWKKMRGDNWRCVSNVKGALDELVASKLEKPAFLATGRQTLSQFTPYEGELVARIVDAPPEDHFGLKNVRFVRGRGPFHLEDEIEIFKQYNIGTIVSKNSGGDGAYAKIEAARMLGIDVIMIDRPQLPDARLFERVEDVMKALHDEALLGE